MMHVTIIINTQYVIAWCKCFSKAEIPNHHMIRLCFKLLLKTDSFIIHFYIFHFIWVVGYIVGVKSIETHGKYESWDMTFWVEYSGITEDATPKCDAEISMELQNSMQKSFPDVTSTSHKPLQYHDDRWEF